MMLLYAFCTLISVIGMYVSQREIRASLAKKEVPDKMDQGFLWASAIVFVVSLFMFIGI